ncbi:MAG: prolipoprotein diacylglyceryl transferase [Paludibacteraceae bacterium]|nr:prolipoprotein diacylglyceryl transferase [Paludibacteraceae bacterium]
MVLDFITWDVSPYIFGDSGVRWYGLLWAIGLYVCWKINEQMYKKENCPAEWPDLLFFWMAAGVIIGARLGHCWFYEWHHTNDPIQIFGWTFNYRNPYIEHPLRLIKIWEGGLSSHGGAIGLIIAAILLNKYKYSKYPQFGTSWLWILDRLCIGVCITGALIRLGNLMNSEIYGDPTTLPWGFIFVNDPYAPKDALTGQVLACHPTQIYEILYCLVAFAITYPMYKFTQARRREGLLLGVFLEVVFFTRFCLEFIKLDQEAFEAGHLFNMGQLLSIPFIALGIYLIIRAYRRPLSPVVEKQPESLDPKYRKTNDKK